MPRTPHTAVVFTSVAISDVPGRAPPPYAHPSPGPRPSKEPKYACFCHWARTVAYQNKSIVLVQDTRPGRCVRWCTAVPKTGDLGHSPIFHRGPCPCFCPCPLSTKCEFAFKKLPNRLHPSSPGKELTAQETNRWRDGDSRSIGAVLAHDYYFFSALLSPKLDDSLTETGTCTVMAAHHIYGHCNYNKVMNTFEFWIGSSQPARSH